jgi:hypothetical protein
MGFTGNISNNTQCTFTAVKRKFAIFPSFCGILKQISCFYLACFKWSGKGMHPDLTQVSEFPPLSLSPYFSQTWSTIRNECRKKGLVKEWNKKKLGRIVRK